MAPPPTNADCYFPSFTLPSWLESGDSLPQLLEALFSDRFADIDRGATRPVEQAFEAVLEVLEDPRSPARTHRRYVTMALILAVASQAWIREYSPADTRAEGLTDQVKAWLESGAPVTSPKAAELYPLVATRYQEFDEARDLHRCLSRMVDEPERCHALLLEILDGSVAGHAVHPSGGLARRDLFHWWLCQAVPAAFMECLPDHIYSGDWPWPPRSAG